MAKINPVQIRLTSKNKYAQEKKNIGFLVSGSGLENLLVILFSYFLF
jgi:hypothetical protein